MALHLQQRAVPQCSSCLRSYAFGSFMESGMRAAPVTQQVRGKKKLANLSATVSVRLLKDVRAFGRKGAVVPIATGQMRNEWFPRRIAEYVTVPELRTLRLKNVAMERDFAFGVNDLAKSTSKDPTISNDIRAMSTPELRDATRTEVKRKPLEVQKLTPERSAELVEIFVPPRLEFYRQPIIEEKTQEPTPEPEPQKVQRERRQFVSSAASDLLAARMPEDKPKAAVKEVKHDRQAIYGSVSTHDVLVAVRAAMGNNDESKRVVLGEEDLHFVGIDEEDATRVKHVGEYALEVRVKGVETGIKRTVRVIAQEL